MNEHLASNPVPEREMAESFSLRALVEMGRRRKAWLIASVVLCTAGSVYWARNLPVIYEARTLMIMNTPPGAGLISWNPATTVNFQFGNIRETVYRRTVLEPAILGLGLGPADGSEVSDTYIGGLKASIGLEVQGQRTFILSFRDRDPEKATKLANQIAEEFVRQTESRDQGRAAARVEFIDAEAKDAELEMLARQEDLRAYTATYGGTLSDSLDGYVGSINRTNEQLADNAREIANLEASRDRALEEIHGLEQLGSSRPGVATPQQINTERVALQQRLDDLLQRYTPMHPEVLRVQAELSRLAESAASATVSDPSFTPAPTAPDNTAFQVRLIGLRADLSSTERRLEFYYDQRAELASEQAEYQNMVDLIGSAPDREQELARLVRDHEAARARYQSLLDRLNQARLEARLQPADLLLDFSIAEAARVPEYPLPSRRTRTVGIGFALGIFLGLGLMLVAHQLDSTFADINEVTDCTGLPVLAGVPRMRQQIFSRASKTPIPTLTDRRSIAAEQYRILAVRIRDMIDREYSHVVLFTSAGGGEGKTTTVANVAVALSQIQEQGVLLLDADLQRPRIRQYLADAGAANLGTEDGLRELLKAPDSLAPELFGRVGKLFVLAGNRGTGESTDALASPGARKLLSRLRKRFRYILIDSPPVLPMADTHLLAEFADRIVFVVRAERTRRETLVRALQGFDLKNVLGMVLNGIALGRTRYAPAYRHYAKHYLPPAGKINVARPPAKPASRH